MLNGRDMRLTVAHFYVFRSLFLTWFPWLPYIQNVPVFTCILSVTFSIVNTSFTFAAIVLCLVVAHHRNGNRYLANEKIKAAVQLCILTVIPVIQCLVRNPCLSSRHFLVFLSTLSNQDSELYKAVVCLLMRREQDPPVFCCVWRLLLRVHVATQRGSKGIS